MSASKSMGAVPLGSLPNRRRMSGMRCNGTPMPIMSWQEGIFTPLIHSVTGCSTCRQQPVKSGANGSKFHGHKLAIYRRKGTFAPMVQGSPIYHYKSLQLTDRAQHLNVTGGSLRQEIYMEKEHQQRMCSPTSQYGDMALFRKESCVSKCHLGSCTIDSSTLAEPSFPKAQT